MLKKTLVKLIGLFGVLLLVSSCGSLLSRNFNNDGVGNNQNENANNNNSESSDFEKYFHFTSDSEEGMLFTRIDSSEYPVGYECAEGGDDGDIYIKLIRQQGHLSGQLMIDGGSNEGGSTCFVLMNFNTESTFEIMLFGELMSFVYLYDEQEETFTMLYNDVPQEDIAPVLGELQITATGIYSITLSVPTFSISGYPQSTVSAYIGLDGMISVEGSVVSGYLEVADVSSYDYQFTNLSPGTEYRIIVVADNGVGYSVREIVQATSTCTALPALAIPDAGLLSAIRTAINKPTGDICQEELAALTSLSAQSNIVDLTGMEYFINLSTLIIPGNQISDISNLPNLTNLTSLDISGNNIADISSLSGLTNLTSLNLSRNNIANISSLSSLTNLTSLDLSLNNNIADISSLSSLTNLTSLNLRYNENIVDISSLSGLTNLTFLDLARFNDNIINISVVSGLINLRSLSLSTKISDVSVLSGLTNLTSLDCWNCQLGDISSFSGLTNLTQLTLGNNQISNISSLSGITGLRVLVLYNNQITDISALSGLTNLTQLSLERNYISNIASLSGLINLTRLDIGGNQIADISSLSGLANLTYLSISGNPLSSVTGLSGITSLTNLYASACQITSTDGLSSLTGLLDLDLRYNQITSIDGLSGLTNLRNLALDDNQIVSITPLMTNFGAGGLVGAYVSLSTNNLDAQALTDAQTLLDNGVTISW